jgi:hypothetical protein
MTGRHDPRAMPASAASSAPPGDTDGVVVELPGDVRKRAQHEPATRRWIAQRVADLLGYRYAGPYTPDMAPGSRLYFVPQSTLLLDRARQLGISTERDLLGGVVPYGFVASKAISHALIDGARVVPEGWSQDLARSLETMVLPGHSAFGREDARDAGIALLNRHAAIRIKPGAGIGGLNQSVVTTAAELDAALDGLDEDATGQLGVVLELNLEDVETYSVGTVRVGDLAIAYVGTQRLTRNHKGHAVYGGSDLTCVRGGYEQLLLATPDPEQRRIIELAIGYEAAVAAAYPPLFASRRNYDVAGGRGEDGSLAHGVLEQSWRIGGATPAEVSALAALAADPKLHRVCTSSHEVYDLIVPPPGAEVYFSAIDPAVGALTKFSLVNGLVSDGPVKDGLVKDGFIDRHGR